MLLLKVRSGARADGRAKIDAPSRRPHHPDVQAWCYIAGNREALRALHYAIGRILASRTLEVLEGPGYTIIYDRKC